MSPVFVDAQFWVARFHPGDQWHEQARSAQADVEGRSLLTSEAVLVEFLNFFSSLEVLLILSQSVFKRLKRLPILALEEIDLFLRFLEACGDVELQKICNFMFRYSPRHRMEKWPLGTIESLGDGYYRVKHHSWCGRNLKTLGMSSRAEPRRPDADISRQK